VGVGSHSPVACLVHASIEYSSVCVFRGICCVLIDWSWTHGCILPLTAGGRHRTAAAYYLSDPASTPHWSATTEEIGEPLALTSDALEHVNLHMIQHD